MKYLILKMRFLEDHIGETVCRVVGSRSPRGFLHQHGNAAVFPDVPSARAHVIKQHLAGRIPCGEYAICEDVPRLTVADVVNVKSLWRREDFLQAAVTRSPGVPWMRLRKRDGFLARAALFVGQKVSPGRVVACAFCEALFLRRKRGDDPFWRKATGCPACTRERARRFLWMLSRREMDRKAALRRMEFRARAARAKAAKASWEDTKALLNAVVPRIIEDLKQQAEELSRERTWPSWWIEVRDEKFEEQGGICGICGERMQKGEGRVHLDHIVPRSRGGPTEPANLQAVHALCNLKKGNSL